MQTLHLQMAKAVSDELKESTMKPDLSKMSVKELREHAKDVELAIEQGIARAKKEAYEKAVAAAEELGLSIEDILPTRTVYAAPVGQARQTSQRAKRDLSPEDFEYWNPSLGKGWNPGQRGKKAAWVEEAEKAGTLEQYRVKATD